MKFLLCILLTILHLYHHEGKTTREQRKTSPDWLTRGIRTKYQKRDLVDRNAAKRQSVPTYARDEDNADVDGRLPSNYPNAPRDIHETVLERGWVEQQTDPNWITQSPTLHRTNETTGSNIQVPRSQMKTGLEIRASEKNLPSATSVFKDILEYNANELLEDSNLANPTNLLNYDKSSKRIPNFSYHYVDPKTGENPSDIPLTHSLITSQQKDDSTDNIKHENASMDSSPTKNDYLKTLSSSILLKYNGVLQDLREALPSHVFASYVNKSLDDLTNVVRNNTISGETLNIGEKTNDGASALSEPVGLHETRDVVSSFIRNKDDDRLTNIESVSKKLSLNTDENDQIIEPEITSNEHGSNVGTKVVSNTLTRGNVIKTEFKNSTVPDIKNSLDIMAKCDECKEYKSTKLSQEKGNESNGTIFNDDSNGKVIAGSTNLLINPNTKIMHHGSNTVERGMYEINFKNKNENTFDDDNNTSANSSESKETRRRTLTLHEFSVTDQSADDSVHLNNSQRDFVDKSVSYRNEPTNLPKDGIQYYKSTISKQQIKNMAEELEGITKLLLVRGSSRHIRQPVSNLHSTSPDADNYRVFKSQNIPLEPSPDYMHRTIVQLRNIANKLSFTNMSSQAVQAEQFQGHLDNNGYVSGKVRAANDPFSMKNDSVLRKYFNAIESSLSNSKSEGEERNIVEKDLANKIPWHIYGANESFQESFNNESKHDLTSNKSRLVDDSQVSEIKKASKKLFGSGEEPTNVSKSTRRISQKEFRDIVHLNQALSRIIKVASERKGKIGPRQKALVVSIISSIKDFFSKMKRGDPTTQEIHHTYSSGDDVNSTVSPNYRSSTNNWDQELENIAKSNHRFASKSSKRGKGVVGLLVGALYLENPEGVKVEQPLYAVMAKKHSKHTVDSHALSLAHITHLHNKTETKNSTIKSRVVKKGSKLDIEPNRLNNNDIADVTINIEVDDNSSRKSRTSRNASKTNSSKIIDPSSAGDIDMSTIDKQLDLVINDNTSVTNGEGRIDNKSYTDTNNFRKISDKHWQVHHDNLQSFIKHFLKSHISRLLSNRTIMQQTLL